MVVVKAGGGKLFFLMNDNTGHGGLSALLEQSRDFLEATMCAWWAGQSGRALHHKVDGV